MSDLKPDKWNPADLDVLLTDVIAAVESGEIDSAFDNTELTSGHLSKVKNTRNYTKNYLSACIRAGVNGVNGVCDLGRVGCGVRSGKCCRAIHFVKVINRKVTKTDLKRKYQSKD